MAENNDTREKTGTIPSKDQAASTAASEITPEELVEAAMEEYDEIACITVDSPFGFEPESQLMIKLYTPEYFGVGESIDLFDDESQVVIEREDGLEDYRYPFEVLVTCDGPPPVSRETCVIIYKNEEMFEEKSVAIAEGLEHLEDRLIEPENWGSTD